MAWQVSRSTGTELDLDEVVALYTSSGLGARRPVHDRPRMRSMLDEANLILVCRDGAELVGIARSLSDFSYVTYLSDLAVAVSHQRRGVGRALIEETERLGSPAKLVLLAAPDAAAYYPRVGFAPHHSAWVRDRCRPQDTDARSRSGTRIVSST